jgi:hypothetical protein
MKQRRSTAKVSRNCCWILAHLHENRPRNSCPHPSLDCSMRGWVIGEGWWVAKDLELQSIKSASWRVGQVRSASWSSCS